MTAIPLSTELALLAYDPDGAARLGGIQLSRGLGGAFLLELALADRIEIAGGKVAVRDPAPLGDPLTDAALARIRADPKPRTAKDWVNRLGRDARRQVLDQLVAAGTLRAERGTVFLVFPRTRYPDAHGTESPAEADARQRLGAAVAGVGDVPARTAALCALVGAVGLNRKVFTDLPRAQVKARLKEISEGAWAAEAVRKAIAEVQAAVKSSIGSAVAASSG